jgi:NitT/TauT family transport system ATP-binding protein
MLIFKNVSKTYKNSQLEKSILAIENVSFEVKEGEFFTILGPSGCGKTTIINIAAGFIDYDRGIILFNGNKITKPSPERIVVFQDHNLLDWKTVWGNIEFGLKALKVKKEKRYLIIKKLLILTHLNGFGRFYPYQLSIGMRQRVALARALAVEPKCILMDEPLASLDSMLRENLQLELLSIWKNTNKTVLMVTHNIEEAIFMSDRIMIMSKNPGRVKSVIPIPIPRPRNNLTRTSIEFQEIKNKVHKIITNE